MVLLTMTPFIVGAISKLKDIEAEIQPQSQAAPEADPSLQSPAIGKPISHGQIIKLWRLLKDYDARSYTLENLLWGARVYVPPAPAKPEPSNEYKALMARLRREEEERKYQRMVSQPSSLDAPPNLSQQFAEINRPAGKADLGDDDVTMNDVHRQVMLVINFLVTIFGCAATLWIVARWWSTPARLFLTLGGTLIVAIAEVAVYSGYVWHIGQARKKDAKIKEVKEIVDTWVRVSSSAGCQDDFESTKDTILTHSAEKHTTQTLVHGTGLSTGTSTSGPCDLSGLRFEITVEKVVSSTVNRSTTADLPVAAIGLQEGDQNTVNKTPRLKRDSSSSTSTDESIQLVTPSSSPTAKQDVKTDATQAETPKPHKSAPAPKTKRRLTLHSGSYDKQTSHKKRKAPPKRKDGVQTTLSLSIGSSAGMRECKLCDTVYNPFHPEDVKVHAKRHAVILKTERRAEEIAGLTESSLVE
ncbi:hypothetical protein N8I77_006707 [Diaporthe amygdali]|uniref:N-acetyltransferase ESCO zinc-finger domain-containing protein n=1 Tax=Phomopsis amygdali TaxID=1214568 RepID=A0AAD9SHJ4_PHOAM|nr:hypothetical protein N8I77_006707 [Diaporthe amygdali]